MTKEELRYFILMCANRALDVVEIDRECDYKIGAYPKYIEHAHQCLDAAAVLKA